jgi:hypothetical protein
MICKKMKIIFLRNFNQCGGVGEEKTLSPKPMEVLVQELVANNQGLSTRHRGTKQLK